MKSVLVAIDSTEHLKDIVKTTVSLFPGVEKFCLVYVLPASYSHFWVPDPERQALAKREIEVKIKEVISSIDISLVPRFRYEFTEGNPLEGLIEFSGKERVEAIVIEHWSSWRNRGPITRKMTIDAISNSRVPITVVN